MANGEPSGRDTPVDSTHAPTEDVVAWSRQVEDEARRLLASGGVDGDTSEEIDNALTQIEADRTNGESARESTMRLERILHRRGDVRPS